MPYYPESKYSKAKSANIGEFVVKSTGKYYKGLYVATFDKKYYSGNSPMDTEIELEKITTIVKNTLAPLGAGILGAAVAGFFKKTLTKAEKEAGVTKRYFIQDRNNNKIVETDKTTYLQTQKDVPNRNFAEVDWIVKGPAEDKMFGNYPFEGAESKNKKAIQALESQMKGISTFITDYKYLVEDPAAVQKPQLTSQVFTELDANTQLENDRKAHFDTRK